jgi:enoyl-CoA hydratase/carnithine racemase
VLVLRGNSRAFSAGFDVAGDTTEIADGIDRFRGTLTRALSLAYQPNNR